MRPPFHTSCAVALATALLALDASAQDVAASEALFERGLAAMERSDFEVGCPAIEESYRLDPRPGTMFTLAECENKRGRTATAATRYEDYLAFFARLTPDVQQAQGERPRVAAAQRDALRGRAPRLTIVVPAGAPADTKVVRDGVALAPPSWGVALPVDPGEVVVRVEATGHDPVERRIRIRDGEAQVVELQLGATSAPPGSPAPTTGASPGAAPHEAGLTGVQTGGVVLGGIGLAAIGVGSVFGIVTMGHQSTVSSSCADSPGPDGITRCRDQRGIDAADAAATTGALSTISFGLGASALVAGVAMLVLGGNDDASTAAEVRPLFGADANGGFAGAHGRF